MKQKFILIALMTGLFFMVGCEDPQTNSKGIGMVEVVNRTGDTITATINKETKLLASNVSKVWTMPVNDNKTLYYKIESSSGRSAQSR